MSGVEALGLACSVFQTISFGMEMYKSCKEFYNGQNTPLDSLLSNAKALKDSSDRLRWPHKANPDESAETQAIYDIAEKCRDTAERLESVVHTIKKNHKGQSVLRALSTNFKSRWYKSNLEGLKQALDDQSNVLNKLLTAAQYKQSDAIILQQSQSFGHLSQQIQAAISQAAQGHRETAELIQNESQHTRAAIKESMEDKRRHSIAAKQQERLLQSLKYPGMNDRFNQITGSDKACFRQIFGTGGHELESSMSRLINQDDDEGPDSIVVSGANPLLSDLDGEKKSTENPWQSFLQWLQGGNNLFWIAGKPGCGKSTFVKFLIEQPETKHYLDEWNPGTILLHHFFWKVGSTLQNNLKGLLCSLLYQLLSLDTAYLEIAFSHIQNFKSKDGESDWSVPELRGLLLAFFVDPISPLCLFIDALDEFSDNEEEDDLLNLLDQLKAHPKVKICISSRPQWTLKLQLEQYPKLWLHELTEYDMRLHIDQELQKLWHNRSMDRKKQLEMTKILLEKADGVFLWLALALRSWKSGLKKDDTDEDLFFRLKDLPAELEKLYEDMWKRLGPDASTYRKAAAWYLKSAVLFQKSCPYGSLALLTLVAAKYPGRMDILKWDKESLINTRLLCDTIQKEILTRCVGFLSVTRAEEDFGTSNEDFKYIIRARVDFVHRTAYDFLDGTESGQQITNHATLPSLRQLSLALARGHLGSMSLFASQGHEYSTRFMFFLELMAPVVHELSRDRAGIVELKADDDVLALLNDSLEVCETLSLVPDRRPLKGHFDDLETIPKSKQDRAWPVSRPMLPTWFRYMTTYYLCETYFPFVIFKLKEIDSRLLNTIVIESFLESRPRISAQTVPFLSLDMDWNSKVRDQDYLLHNLPYHELGPCSMTVFAHFCLTLARNLREDFFLIDLAPIEEMEAASAFLQHVLLNSQPDLDQRVVFAISAGTSKGSPRVDLYSIYSMEAVIPSTCDEVPCVLFVEVDLRIVLRDICNTMTRRTRTNWATLPNSIQDSLFTTETLVSRVLVVSWGNMTGQRYHLLGDTSKLSNLVQRACREKTPLTEGFENPKQSFLSDLAHLLTDDSQSKILDPEAGRVWEQEYGIDLSDSNWLEHRAPDYEGPAQWLSRNTEN